jgi:uncharacterized repeat protein (TIGR03847 family)
VSDSFELDPVSRITAAAVGEPGERAFYLQARKEDVLVSLLVEKQQVALLAVHVDELLDRIGSPDESDPSVPQPSDLDLEEPVVPSFRVGQIGLGYDEERDMVLVQCNEYVPEDETEPPIDDPGRVRLWATRGQVYALARRGEQEVAAGRPVCGMCGRPMEPGGHFCPRSNGHRDVTDIA